MNSIAFLTYDFVAIDPGKPLVPNGCAWYRCVLPALELKKRGWLVGFGLPAWSEAEGFGLLTGPTESLHGYDVIVLKLIQSKTVADLVPQAQALGQKVWVDVDDYFEGLSDQNLAKMLTDPSRNEEVNRDHYLRIIEQADGVIVSTPFLRDLYESRGKKVVMVRNGIDDRWTPRKDHAGWLPVVGWVGAVGWRSGDLETMTGLNGFLQDNRLTFHHSGYLPQFKSAGQMMNLTVKESRQGMAYIDQYPSLFRKIDIGLVPLSDVPFNHAKSAIKGLEYAASGIPFVASWSPEYEWLAAQGIGRVAKTQDEYVRHLTDLLDPKVRKQDRERNLEALSGQSMKVRGTEWDEVLTQIKEDDI